MPRKASPGGAVDVWITSETRERIDAILRGLVASGRLSPTDARLSTWIREAIEQRLERDEGRGRGE